MFLFFTSLLLVPSLSLFYSPVQLILTGLFIHHHHIIIDNAYMTTFMVPTPRSLANLPLPVRFLWACGNRIVAYLVLSGRVGGGFWAGFSMTRNICPIRAGLLCFNLFSPQSLWWRLLVMHRWAYRRGFFFFFFLRQVFLLFHRVEEFL